MPVPAGTGTLAMRGQAPRHAQAGSCRSRAIHGAPARRRDGFLRRSIDAASAAQGRHLDKTPSTGRMTTCNIRRVLLISQNP
ncbi:hypothetical protein L509_4380 [Bordetella bronchiseptica M85/00/2]|nr:hypothetical protein L509_4380 [Bordetella bronchiseptica M85/00/2]